MNDVLSAIQEIAADLFEMEPEDISESFSPESNPTWDSIKHLGLVTAIEDQFDLMFEPEEIDEMKDIASIVRIVKAHSGNG